MYNSLETWDQFGLSFLYSTRWNPVKGEFGAAAAIIGTLVTTTIAVMIAVPCGFVTAFYLSELPRWPARILSGGLDLLAAIPSVIYGMWGLFVLVPIMDLYVQPFVVHTLGLGAVPLVGKEFNGFGYFTAGLVLALMILPFISAMMRDVFRMIPALLKEAAIGIGCTHWEAARDVMLRYGLRGLFGAVFIGLGRALGETMAVLFVIGNITVIPTTIFGNGTTIAATLANNFAEADGAMKSALFALALVLMIMSVCAQCCAQYYLKRAHATRG